MIELALAWAKDHWKFVVGITTIVVTFGFGYYKGYSHEHANYSKHLQDDAAAVALAKAENERRIAEQKEITANVTEGYAHAITSLKQYYATHPDIKWLSTSCPTPGLPKVSDPSSGTNESAKGDTVSTEGLTPEQWAEDVMTILKWQEWARKQQEVR